MSGARSTKPYRHKELRITSREHANTRFDPAYISKVGCEGQMAMKSLDTPDKE